MNFTWNCRNKGFYFEGESVSMKTELIKVNKITTLNKQNISQIDKMNLKNSETSYEEDKCAGSVKKN